MKDNIPACSTKSEGKTNILLAKNKKNIKIPVCHAEIEFLFVNIYPLLIAIFKTLWSLRHIQQRNFQNCVLAVRQNKWRKRSEIWSTIIFNRICISKHINHSADNAQNTQCCTQKQENKLQNCDLSVLIWHSVKCDFCDRNHNN